MDDQLDKSFEDLTETSKNEGNEVVATKRIKEVEISPKSPKKMKGEENRQTVQKNIQKEVENSISEENWTNEEICNYISSKGFSSEVIDIFKECKITGMNIPDLIDEISIKDFGITAKGTIKGLVRLFSNIKNK